MGETEEIKDKSMLLLNKTYVGGDFYPLKTEVWKKKYNHLKYKPIKEKKNSP